jgi:hypothetical protein
MFNENPPSNAKSPLKNSNHPKTDMTEFLDEEGIQKYQLLIGSMQWAIIIGCFDTSCNVWVITTVYLMDTKSPSMCNVVWCACICTHSLMRTVVNSFM